MNVGSLFSGIGGIDLGFEAEGFRTAWFVEWDQYRQAVLRKHWTTPIYGDVTQIDDFSQLSPVDVLVGGFPCQDISYAGKGAGIEGNRSKLWKNYHKAIGQIRPKYAVIENVPALTSRGLNVVLADLASIGYDAEWFCLSALDFGALHRRNRIFIIAYPGEKRCFHQEPQEQSGEGREQAQREPTPRIITHTWQERIQRFKQETFQREQGFSWCKDVRRIEDLRGRRDIPQPLFRGSSDGIPHWVDRVASLGDSVSPPVIQFIARAIKEAEERMMAVSSEGAK